MNRILWGNLMFLWLFAPQSTLGQLLYVEDFKFCQDVAQHQPVGILGDSARLKEGERLYVWFKMRGDERALKVLETWQRLPIYYTWTPEGGINTGLVDIGIKTNNWSEHLERLKGQCRENGYFTWRTYGYSRHLHEGQWYISILDINKKIIHEIPPPANLVCRPKIELKRN